MFVLVGWSVDWLIGWCIDWLIIWLIHTLTVWLFDWLVRWLVDHLIDSYINYLIDWLIDELVGWSVLVRLSVGWLNGWLKRLWTIGQSIQSQVCVMITRQEILKNPGKKKRTKTDTKAPAELKIARKNNYKYSSTRVDDKQYLESYKNSCHRDRREGERGTETPLPT